MNATKKPGRAIDITDMSDAVFDVLFSGEEVANVEHLSAKERQQVAEALGWDMSSAYIRAWIAPAPRTVGPRGRDYEGAILARQEDFSA